MIDAETSASRNKHLMEDLAHTSYNSTDWNAYRLTWIYFAKAEALMRKNGGAATAEAVQLINDSRKRAFTPADWASRAYTVATLTLDELLAERGREFIFEGFRRQDLIRWNKFTTASWWDHTPTEETKKIISCSTAATGAESEPRFRTTDTPNRPTVNRKAVFVMKQPFFYGWRWQSILRDQVFFNQKDGSRHSNHLAVHSGHSHRVHRVDRYP